MKLNRRNQMTFYDIDLKSKIAEKHILWDIEKIISFSSLMYRLKDLESKLGRKGWGRGRIKVSVSAIPL